MDMKKITVWFSRDLLGGLIVAAAVGFVLPASPALADGFGATASFTGPSAVFSAGPNGFTAMPVMPTVTVSNVDPAATEEAFAAPSSAGGGAAMQSLGSTGSGANTSYTTGGAPEDANMSGLTTQVTAQQYPTSGPGTNVGPSPTTNGLMAPFSVNPAGIPLWEGAMYGFNANPATTIFGTDLSNHPDTMGAVLPVTSTGSVNINTTLGNGY
jgi:hypothetical protein